MGSTETFDPTDGNVQKGTLDVDCTFTLNAPTGSGASTLELYLTSTTGAETVTWPGSVVWPGGTAPTLGTGGAGSVDRIILETLDGGTTWYGTQVGGGSSFTAGGDLSGTSTSQTVAKINGSPLGSLSPALADRLRWDGAAWVNSALIWAPVMVLDPGSGNYLVLTDTSGNAIMAEV